MTIRKRVWWWLAAAAYVWLCWRFIPVIEDFYSPFPIQLRALK